MNDGTTRPFVPTHSTEHRKGNDQHDTVKDKIVELGDKVIEVKAKVIEVKDALIDRGGTTADKIRRYATAHPLKAIAIAFAIGYIGMRVTRPLRWL